MVVHSVLTVLCPQCHLGDVMRWKVEVNARVRESPQCREAVSTSVGLCFPWVHGWWEQDLTQTAEEEKAEEIHLVPLQAGAVLLFEHLAVRISWGDIKWIHGHSWAWHHSKPQHVVVPLFGLMRGINTRGSRESFLVLGIWLDRCEALSAQSHAGERRWFLVHSAHGKWYLSPFASQLPSSFITLPVPPPYVATHSRNSNCASTPPLQ